MELGDLLDALACEPLHERLRQLRVQLGVSQRQLADACFIDPSVLCRLEKGADARLTTWVKVLDALGCELVIRKISDENVLDLWPEKRRREENRLKGLEQNW